MGYCYDNAGKLVCDICGAVPARKIPCPFGYCPAIAACEKCRKDHSELFSPGYHRLHGCEESHRKFQEQEEKRKQLIRDGFFVRCSAKRMGDGWVLVLFEGRDGSKGFYMRPEHYDKISLGEIATIEDFLTVSEGNMIEGPSTYEGGGITKCLTI